MRRRGIGIGAVQRNKEIKKQYEEKGSQMATSHILLAHENLKEFRANLEQFSLKHKSKIQKDPEFRRQFQKMCSKIGVDPLASNKGFWSELLDMGDFYYQLSIQAIEVGIKTRPRNGGLIAMDDLLRLVQDKRGRHVQAVTEDDIRRAINKLSILGEGFNVVELNGRAMVSISVDERSFQYNREYYSF